MKKKLLAGLLVLIMAVSVVSLVACNNSNGINTVGAKAFIDWMMSDEALNIIKDYGKAEYSEALFYLNDGLDKSEANIPDATKKTKTIRISTTTSVNDSGLLGALVPVFEEKYGYDVEVASAGTGAAIQAARDKNADLILVHSKSQEEKFVSEGYALKVDGYDTERISFMHNFFIVAGPTADPAGVASANTVKAAFANIASTSSAFISRGDESGTHTAELKLWDAALNITKEGAPESLSWYNHTGQGMGACLTIANEKGGYVLSDKSTFLSYKKATPDKVPNLSILFEQDSDLRNTYTMIAVNPAAFDKK